MARSHIYEVYATYHTCTNTQDVRRLRPASPNTYGIYWIALNKQNIIFWPQPHHENENPQFHNILKLRFSLFCGELYLESSATDSPAEDGQLWAALYFLWLCSIAFTNRIAPRRPHPPYQPQPKTQLFSVQTFRRVYRKRFVMNDVVLIICRSRLWYIQYFPG